MPTLNFSKKRPITASETEEFLAFAKAIVVEAGHATLPFFRADIQADDKTPGAQFDPVTEADLASERAIRLAVEKKYPVHGIYGEEFGFKSGNGLTWVIDPIDGTRAFVAGALHWGVLLGLFDGENVVLGVMYQPFTQELFWGDGKRAWYRREGEPERALGVSKCRRIEDASLTTTGPQFFETFEREAFRGLEEAVKTYRYGGDCYIYSMLALGCVDIATDFGLKPYDIQALVPIIRGAGGVISTVQGSNPSLGGWIVASATQELHDEVLAKLKNSLAARALD